MFSTRSDKSLFESDRARELTLQLHHHHHHHVYQYGLGTSRVTRVVAITAIAMLSTMGVVWMFIGPQVRWRSGNTSDDCLVTDTAAFVTNTLAREHVQLSPVAAETFNPLPIPPLSCPTGELDRLKIYIYDDLPQALTFRCEEIEWTRYGLEHVIPDLIKRGPYYTTNKAEATLFLVPTQTAGFHLCPSRIGQPAPPISLGRQVKLFLDAQAEYRRRRGADHVFIFSTSMGRTALGDSSTDQAAINRAIFLMTDGSNAAALMNPHHPSKDVLVPGYLDGPVDLHKYHSMQMGSRFTGRKRFMFFFASSDFASPVRKEIWTHWNANAHNRTDVLVQTRFQYRSDYLKKLSISTFCLCPAGGSSSTLRIFEAVISGCIPVILNDAIVLPFQQHIDYRKFSIRLPEGSVRALYLALSAVSKKRIFDMREEMVQVWTKVAYFMPERNLGVQLMPKPSAMNIIYCELSKRIPSKYAVETGDYWNVTAPDVEPFVPPPPPVVVPMDQTQTLTPSTNTVNGDEIVTSAQDAAAELQHDAQDGQGLNLDPQGPEPPETSVAEPEPGNVDDVLAQNPAEEKVDAALNDLNVETSRKR